MPDFSLVRCTSMALAASLTITVSGQIASQQRGETLTPDELRRQTRTDLSVPLVSFPAVNSATSRDWPLHNLDPANSRYATSNQITSSNVKSLAVRWLFHTRASASSPIVVDGVMYVTTAESVIALNAATGRAIWTNSEAGSNRGAAYGDGKIYLARDARVFALDAKTGKFVVGFGDRGVSHALTDLLKARFPALEKPAAWGYWGHPQPPVCDA